MWQKETQIQIETRKALELFCFLLLHRDRTHSREALTETIWGEISNSHGKKYLRQALWQIQSSFPPNDGVKTHPVILAESEWIQISPEANLWLDIAEFEQAYADTQGKIGYELDPGDFIALKKAADLYSGDLMETWYEDWCLFERERLQNMYLIMLDKLMGYCETHQAYEDALEFGERILRCDVAHERTHRRMVRIYYMKGDRTTALRQYERCLIALQEELGVKPAQKTVTLYEQIRQDQFFHPSQSIENTPLSIAPSNVLDRLIRLENLVNGFHQHILDEIRALEGELTSGS